MFRLGTGVRAAAVGAWAVLLAACGPGSRPAACSLVGADPGVTFWYVEVVGSHPDHGISVTACVGTMCQHLTTGRNHPLPVIHVTGNGLDSSPQNVSLRVVDASGRPLFAGHTRVHPTEDQPNGPGCPPDVWVARVDATGVHDLRQVR